MSRWNGILRFPQHQFWTPQDTCFKKYGSQCLAWLLRLLLILTPVLNMNRGNRSFVLNNGKKMTLRSLYVLICPVDIYVVKRSLRHLQPLLHISIEKKVMYHNKIFLLFSTWKSAFLIIDNWYSFRVLAKKDQYLFNPFLRLISNSISLYLLYDCCSKYLM